MVGIVGCVWLHKYTEIRKYIRSGREKKWEDFFFFFLSPSAQSFVRNANEIRQIAKLYSEGNVLFFLSLTRDGLDFGERGAIACTHQDEHSHLATDLFLFHLFRRCHREFLSSRGIHRGPQHSFIPIFRRYLKFLLPSALLLFNNE